MRYFPRAMHLAINDTLHMLHKTTATPASASRALNIRQHPRWGVRAVLLNWSIKRATTGRLPTHRLHLLAELESDN